MQVLASWWFWVLCKFGAWLYHMATPALTSTAFKSLTHSCPPALTHLARQELFALLHKMVSDGFIPVLHPLHSLCLPVTAEPCSLTVTGRRYAIVCCLELEPGV